MDSGTKRILTEEELSRIVRQAFSSRLHEAAEIGDGWANTAYAIRTADGLDVILKVAPAKSVKMMRYETNMMFTEVDVQRRLWNGGSIPVPNVFAHDASFSIIDSEYYIMERIQGDIYKTVMDTMTQQERNRIERQIGAYNRELNALHGDAFGYYGQKERQTDDWKNAFTRMVGDLLADGRDAEVELPQPYAVIEQEIKSRMDVLNEVVTPCLVDWDLWEANVLVRDGIITGIIDFERAMWGDPVMEYYFSHFAKSQAFLDGYGMGKFTQGQRMRRALYDLYLDLILWIECFFRKYEDESHIEWARNNLSAGWDRFLSSRE
jgi:aminoglycoside phosphotransferase (APT) family kinase protein